MTNKQINSELTVIVLLIEHCAEKSELENVLHEKAEIIWSKFRYAGNFL